MRLHSDLYADQRAPAGSLRPASHSPQEDGPDRIIAILPPETESIRARRVVSRSRARPTGKYPSWKMRRMLQWESVAELNAMRLLDADPAVRAYAEQPCVIKYRLNGEEHRHYPDLLIHRHRGQKELWEVKPEKEASQDTVAARTAFLDGVLPNHGYAYRIVHSEDLRREPRLSNILLILQWGRAPLEAVERERARRLLAVHPTITWSAAESGALGPSGRRILCRFALEGILAFDVNQKLDSATAFSLSFGRSVE